MDDEQIPIPEPNDLVVERRSLDPEIIAGIIAGAGAAAGPALGELTGHWLSGKDEPEPPHVELPPGVDPD
jgi:hypothetical protein